MKRCDVINYLKNTKADIICLQDTHLTESDTAEVKDIWDGEFILHGRRHNARGVAIFLGKRFEYKIIHTDMDNDGNLLLVDMQISEISIRLINIYGPNIDDVSFYTSVANKIQFNNQDYILWCGDFNMTLNPALDTFNYININNPKSRKYVSDLLLEHNLVDLYRYYNPDKRRYTWRKTNPLKQARLDYFVVTSSFTDISIDTEIKPGYRSDHSILECTFLISNFKRGRGTWKLNTSLLKDREYLLLINNCIQDEFLKYAALVYELDFVKEPPFKDIQLTIDYDLFLEVLLRGSEVNRLNMEHIKRK